MIRRLSSCLFLIFVGSLAGAATGSQSLTLTQAITLAIQNNLSTQLAKAETEEARGQAMQTASALLPHLLGNISQTRTFKENLLAQGFPADVFPFSPILGPFDTFDARLRLSQSIFDLNALWSHQAARARVDAARWQEQFVKEQVATAAAMAYLEALRTERSVAAAQSNVDLATSLLNLARDQHRAGISTGVDLARAETRSAEQNVQLIRAQVAAREAAMRLKRVLCLPLAEAVTLVDPLRATPLNLPAEDQAVSTAQTQRAELQLFRERLHADDLTWRAARAGHLPTIVGNADYGFSGNLPDSTARTGSIGASLTLPIFYGGQIAGEVKEALGHKQESEARYNDTRQQVEEDVRLSLETLTAEMEEVKATDLAVQLAERELKMAKDRYSAGVGDNIQLTTAQTVLAQARDEQVDTLARYNTARINLSMALGEMQAFQL